MYVVRNPIKKINFNTDAAYYMAIANEYREILSQYYFNMPYKYASQSRYNWIYNNWNTCIVMEAYKHTTPELFHSKYRLRMKLIQPLEVLFGKIL